MDGANRRVNILCMFREGQRKGGKGRMGEEEERGRGGEERGGGEGRGEKGGGGKDNIFHNLLFC